MKSALFFHIANMGTGTNEEKEAAKKGSEVEADKTKKAG
jgi:hypothetical protein